MAKRNDDQAIENKRFREIADSAPSMISITYGAMRNVWFRLAKRILSFSRFLAPSTQETKPGVARRDGGYELKGTWPGTRCIGQAEGAKTLRKRARNSLKELARVNLCARPSGRIRERREGGMLPGFTQATAILDERVLCEFRGDKEQS
jgi:hypothetical protein